MKYSLNHPGFLEHICQNPSFVPTWFESLWWNKDKEEGEGEKEERDWNSRTALPLLDFVTLNQSFNSLDLNFLIGMI